MTNTAKFEKLARVGAEYYNDRANCAVIALAIFADVSYGKAHAALKRAGRKNRCRTEPSAIEAAAVELVGAIELREVSPCTFTTYAGEQEGSSIAFASTHCAAVENGIVHDDVASRKKRVLVELRKAA